MKRNLAKVKYSHGGSDSYYGPFSDMEYLAFVDWLRDVVNPNWKMEIENVLINESVTNVFLTMRESSANV